MLIDYLKSNLLDLKNIFDLPLWNSFVTTKDFNDICSYICREFEIFRVYFDQLYEKVLQSSKVNNVDEGLRAVINSNFSQNLEKPFAKTLIQYVRDILQDMTIRKPTNKEEIKKVWVHIDRILDCLRLQSVFQFEDEKNRQFNFKYYYEEVNVIDLDSLVKRVDEKLKILNII